MKRYDVKVDGKNYKITLGGRMKLDKHGKMVYSEKEISAQIRSYLRTVRRDIFWWSNQAFRFQTTSVPDIEGILPDGTHFYIEVKKIGGKLSEKQADFIKQVTSRGELALVAYCLDDVISWLTRNAQK